MNRVIVNLAACLFVLLVCIGTAQAQRPQQPYVRIVSPRTNECVPGPDVTVQFDAGGMCFSPCGNNIHFMLDDEPFEAQFDLTHPHVFQDVAPGTHTIRAYAANHLHEAIQGTLDVITFSVAYPNDENRPEFGEPLLTYNLPQGEYLGIDAGDITINWMVDGVALSRRGYRVQYYVDGRRFIVYDCNTRHIKGLAPGYHTFKIELVDERGRVAPGPFNSTERVVLVNPDQLAKTYSAADRNPDLPKIPSIHGAMTRGWPTAAVDEAPPIAPRKAATLQQNLTVRRADPTVRVDRTDASDAEETAGVTDLDPDDNGETEIKTTRVRVDQDDTTEGEESTDKTTTTSIQWQMPGQTVNRSMTTVRSAAGTTASVTKGESEGPQAALPNGKPAAGTPVSGNQVKPQRASSQPVSYVTTPTIPAPATAASSSSSQSADSSKTPAPAVPSVETMTSAGKSAPSAKPKEAKVTRGTANTTAAAAMKMLSLISESEKSGHSRNSRDELFERKKSALNRD